MRYRRYIEHWGRLPTAWERCPSVPVYAYTEDLMGIVRSGSRARRLPTMDEQERP